MSENKEISFKELAEEIKLAACAKMILILDKEVSVLWKITIINTLVLLYLVFAAPAKAVEFNKIESKYGIPKNLLKAICYVESNHNSKAVRKNDGNHDSLGICQVQLPTAKWLGYSGDTTTLLDPHVNARYAAIYLKVQHGRYSNWYDAVAAYNAGQVKKNDFGYYTNYDYVQKVREACHKFDCQMSSKKALEKAPFLQ